MKKIPMEKEFITDLKIGEDRKAREHLDGFLNNTINKSISGEIGLADYLEELKRVVSLGEDYLKECNLPK